MMRFMRKQLQSVLECLQREVIDEINILQATYKAMQQAISKLSVKPDLLLNDAVTIPEVDDRDRYRSSKEMQKVHRSQRQVLLRKLQETV